MYSRVIIDNPEFYGMYNPSIKQSQFTRLNYKNDETR